MFHNQLKDKYDFILGHDLLKILGLNIYYSASQFVWDNITVEMVPSGYWTKNKISSVAKSEKEELHLAKILPADEKEQLKNVLFEFQDLFQGR
jgi:hypothetical protein